MRTALEQAGAERGLVDFFRGAMSSGSQAEATTDGEYVTVHLRDEDVGCSSAAGVGASTMSCALRKALILDDASSHNPFSADPYIVQRHRRSILCLPLINQGKLTGILYLENNLTPRRLHARPRRSVEGACVAGGDLARKFAALSRPRRSRREDSAFGRRQHHRDLHCRPRRSDS